MSEQGLTQQGVDGGSPSQEGQPAGNEAGADRQQQETPEEQRIPMSRFNQVNNQKKQLAEDLEGKSAEVAKLQAELERVKREREREKAFEGVPEEMREHLKKLIELQDQPVQENGRDTSGQEEQRRQSLEWRIFKQLGQSLSDGQVDVIAEIQSDNPRIKDVQELLLIAKMREPDLFAELETRGGSPHFVQPAGQGRVEKGRDKMLADLQAEWQEVQHTDPTRARDVLFRLLKEELAGEI